MNEEMIDIFNEEGEHIGVEKKSLVKKKGFWHNTFQCWVIIEENGEKFVVFQRRHHTKKFNPNKLATSAGGHIMAGETIEEGIRELNEELGIYPDISELSYLGLFKEVRKTEKEDNKENQHVYLYSTHKPLNEFKFQLEELSGLYKMKLEDFYSLTKETKQSVKSVGIEWKETSYEEKTINISLKDIVGYGTPFLKWSVDRIFLNLNSK